MQSNRKAALGLGVLCGTSCAKGMTTHAIMQDDSNVPLPSPPSFLPTSWGDTLGGATASSAGCDDDISRSSPPAPGAYLQLSLLVHEICSRQIKDLHRQRTMDLHEAVFRANRRVRMQKEERARNDNYNQTASRRTRTDGSDDDRATSVVPFTSSSSMMPQGSSHRPRVPVIRGPDTFSALMQHFRPASPLPPPLPRDPASRRSSASHLEERTENGGYAPGGWESTLLEARRDIDEIEAFIALRRNVVPQSPSSPASSTLLTSVSRDQLNDGTQRIERYPTREGFNGGECHDDGDDHQLRQQSPSVRILRMKGVSWDADAAHRDEEAETILQHQQPVSVHAVTTPGRKVLFDDL